MAINLDLTDIDPYDPSLATMLDDLQGNILKGHGREHTFNLFVRFRDGYRHEARNWISAFTKNFVQSATQQLEDVETFHRTNKPGGLFANLFLTKAGYAYLGVDKTPDDQSFAAGMKSAKDTLGDPDASHWDAGFDAKIHMMVLIGDDDERHGHAMKLATVTSLDPIAYQLRYEKGTALRDRVTAPGDKKGIGIEHNGYADGVSQPLFLKDDIDKEAERIGDTNWKPKAPLKLALVADPNGATDDSYGSYFVFRKLEQDVRGFKTREKSAAIEHFHLPADDTTWTPAQQAQKELIGGWVVGRFENGTPVILHGSDEADVALENDFNYNMDVPGTKCPYFAHIRKSNPRNEGGLGEEENKMRRLVRRGIPFEAAPRKRDENGDLSEEPATDMPKFGDGYGLLFMCFVADIGNQFEFVQSAWVNNPNFAVTTIPHTAITGHPGKDPIIGQPQGNHPHSFWPKDYGVAPYSDMSFGNFVRMKGGAYFFAPSRQFLMGLKTTYDLAKLDSHLVPFVEAS